MTPALGRASLRLVPSRAMRAGMLAYVGALAAIEMCDGIIVAEVWRDRRRRVSVDPTDLTVLGEMFERLRVIEAVVVAAAVVTTVLWSFIAVRNASTACRDGRSGAAAVVAWTLAPLAVVALGVEGEAAARPGVLAAQAAILFVPFATIGAAATRVGGRLAPFVRWYVALVLVFLVHRAFTGSFNLADTKPSDDLGRAAALMVVNGLALGVMVLMAADAARSIESATHARVAAHFDWRAEAMRRFRHAAATITGQATSGDQRRSELAASDRGSP